MARLEYMTRGTHVTGISPGGAATVVAGEWHAGGIVDLTHRDPDGNLGSRLIYGDDKPQITAGHTFREARCESYATAI